MHKEQERGAESIVQGASLCQGEEAEGSRGVRGSTLSCRAGVGWTGAAASCAPAWGIRCRSGAPGAAAGPRRAPVPGEAAPRLPLRPCAGRAGRGWDRPGGAGAEPGGAGRAESPAPAPQRRPDGGEPGPAAPGTRGWPGCPCRLSPGWGSLSPGASPREIPAGRRGGGPGYPLWLIRGAVEAAAAFPCAFLARRVSFRVRRSCSAAACGDSAG